MNQLNGVPLIKLEIEGMRHTLVTALNERMLNFDSYINNAVTEFCKDDNIIKIINKAVSESLQHAVENETRNFFNFGEGRVLVKQVVLARLQQEITEHRLNDHQ